VIDLLIFLIIFKFFSFLEFKARKTVINFVRDDSTERALRKIQTNERQKKSAENKENEGASPPNMLVRALQAPPQSRQTQSLQKEIKFVSIMRSEIKQGKPDILPFSPTGGDFKKKENGFTDTFGLDRGGVASQERQALGLQTRLMNVNMNPLNKY
jgi:hypothetical protein